MPSLGLGLGDLSPRGPLGAEDDGEDGTPSASRVDSERKPGICVRACVCMCEGWCMCVYMCVGVLTGAQCQSDCSNWGPEREAQVDSGVGCSQQ